MLSKRRKVSKICQNCKKEFHPFNTSTGIFCSLQCSRKYLSGPNHPMWKGDSVGYQGVHAWFKGKKGTKCEFCGKNGLRLELAKKKDKKYERKIENYYTLCRKCHVNYDRTPEWRVKSIEILKKTYAHTHPIQPKACQLCNQQFVPTRKTRQFCSNHCSAKWRVQFNPAAMIRYRNPITNRYIANHSHDKE